MEELAAFAAKNPDLVVQKGGIRVVQTPFGFKRTAKLPSTITSLIAVLGPKGDKILRETENLAGLRFKKRLGRIGSVARPILLSSSLGGVAGRLPRAAALGLNLFNISPLDVVVSFIFAIVNVRKSLASGEFGGEIRITKDDEEIEGRIVTRFGQETFVREEASGQAFLITETFDQLAFGLVPEGQQEEQTEDLSLIFEAVIRAGEFLSFTGFEGESQAAPALGTGRF